MTRYSDFRYLQFKAGPMQNPMLKICNPNHNCLKNSVTEIMLPSLSQRLPFCASTHLPQKYQFLEFLELPFFFFFARGKTSRRLHGFSWLCHRFTATPYSNSAFTHMKKPCILRTHIHPTYLEVRSLGQGFLLRFYSTYYND